MNSDYPDSPGCKEKGGTSEEAARAYHDKAVAIRQKVESIFERHPHDGWIPEEVADILGLTVHTVRSRFTELGKRSKIYKSVDTRNNAGGHKIRVWRKWPSR